MNITQIFIFTAALATSGMTIANTTLEAERNLVVSRYVHDLQTADYKDITQLFSKTGIVVSTSRGRINAKDFFYSFLPEIASAHTQLNQRFSADTNRLAARFHFDYQMKDGETGSGEYVDEFVFVDNSTQLAAVYMFENLKFKDTKSE